jgi:hypothetical protein
MVRRSGERPAERADIALIWRPAGDMQGRIGSPYGGRNPQPFQWPRAVADRTRDQAGETGMSTFDRREEAFENKFAHDEELRFKAVARRNKLLGLWAAEKLGLDADKAQDYAKEVVRSDFEEPGEEDVFRKIRKDFDDAGVDQSDHQIRRTMDELLQQAAEQIQNEG